MQLLTNGKAFLRSDGRWGGTVWYKDDDGQRKRKSFCAATEQEVNIKMARFVAEFYRHPTLPTQPKRIAPTLKESMQDWLRIYKFPNIERTTYDRYEATARHQIYPFIGDMPVTSVSSKDIQLLLNKLMLANKSYSTVKKTYILLGEFFRHLAYCGAVPQNPILGVMFMKKENFCAAQGKELKPLCENVTVFSGEEIARIKTELQRRNENGKLVYPQGAAYILMLNTGLRTGELLGLFNKDIDLVNRIIHVRHGVKVSNKRDGYVALGGLQVTLGKTKTPTSVRDLPMNDIAFRAIILLRQERYFGENSPLVPDENGNITIPANFRYKFRKLMKNCGIQGRSLHSLRHTFATKLVNGIRMPDGSICNLTVKQVADLLGHSTSEVTELYYVKRDPQMLKGITDNFNL